MNGDILLLIQHKGNHEVLSRLLSSHYVLANYNAIKGSETPPDLMIADVRSMIANADGLRAYKASKAPEFLPLLVLAAREELAQLPPDQRALIDEIIAPPVDLHELLTRITVLIRTRRQSIELVAARVKAEEANTLKLRFIAMISHELRNPLASIKGLVTTLLATDVTWNAEDDRRFLVAVDEETDKLNDLIEQLLDVSRLEIGMLRVDVKLCDWRDILQVAYTSLKTLTAGHTLVFETPDDTELLLVDVQRTAQVLLNLVGNAARYSPEGTTIAVRAIMHGDFLQIEVSDQGVGIPPEARATVFEPFRQADRAAAHSQKGAGLGLAIAKGVIEGQGGRIWIQDEEAPGTTIAFTLPLLR